MKSFFYTILLSAAVFFEIFAQSGAIKGTVTDKEGNAAPFVSIQLSELKKGSNSAENGEFSITNIKGGSYTLIASFVGYKTLKQKVKIEEGKTLNLSLQLFESAEMLKEIVVKGTYAANRTTSLGKATIPPLDLPQSTAVVSNVVIADQQAVRLGDVVKNVSGVSLTETRGGVAETFSSRGYSIGVAGAGGVSSKMEPLATPWVSLMPVH